MAIEQIDLELIHDNPYQARSTYHRQDIDDLAHSIKTHGLLQVPPGRRKDGNVELGFGHLRKRAFVKLAKKEPEKFGKMPVDIRDLSDEQMAIFALEENLKRRDITPLETARAVDNYLYSFLEKTEVEVAEYLNMTKGNVSNMRRVLRLPEKILQKIDEGRITFTQGRELIILERVDNSEELMLTAARSIRTEGRPYGHANTVEGMQRAVHEVIANHCRPLDKEFEGYRYDLIFDTRVAGCLECEKMIRTHPTKSTTAHYCLDDKCWDRHQEKQQEKVSAEAKAKMEADILRRATQETISQEIPASCGDCPTLNECIGSPVWQTYKGNPTCPNRGIKPNSQAAPQATIPQEIPLSTYRIQNLVSKEWWDGEAVSPEAACQAASWRKEDCWVRFLTEKGGWAKVDFSQEKSELPAKRRPIPVVANAEGIALPVPCQSCAKAETCDRTLFHVAPDNSGLLVCEQKVEAAKEILPAASEIPDDSLALAREKAGTRAEVLDLKDIGAGYYGDVKQGYALLDGFDRALEHILDPDECLERCTHGFHFAFDSRHDEPRTRYVCSDPKCLTKKKAAFTRAKNAEGQARKNAERKAVKEAIAQTTTMNRAQIKLILLAQMDGRHTERGYYSGSDGKQPETWLWERLSAGTPAIERKREDLFKRIDKLSDEELAKLVVEFMFYYLTDKGDIGSYEIKTTEPLKWMGITIQQEASLNMLIGASAEGNKEHA